MTTLVLTHPECITHDPGRTHPEAPARLSVILKALEEPEFDGLIRDQAPLAAPKDLFRVHDRMFVERVLGAVPKSGHTALDSDTILSPGSGQAAQRAAGAVSAAVDKVVGGSAHNAFCAVRPPGHHAEPLVAMGFCLFNSVAVAARHAQAELGLQRIAIVDFDVHHGNGTQSVVETDSTLFYASTHQYPLYPGTGASDETGVGNVVNVPLKVGADGAALRRAFEKEILPALDLFAPELLLISAGFDAHRADPLAGLEFEDEDFAWVTARLLESAQCHCHGRLVSVLEGGYNLRALASSVSAHLRELMRAS